MKLGDVVEKVIHTVSPNTKQCKACVKRKEFLNEAPAKIYTKFKNNLNATFR